MENNLFDGVDFKIAYNAILGRPSLTKFMVVVHYAYQCVKIQGLKESSRSEVAPKLASVSTKKP